MKLITQSRLLGVLLIAASLPFDTGMALALQATAAALEAPAPGQSAMEARLQRIAAAARSRQQAATDASPLGPDAISFVVLGPGGVGWANVGWNNGGFYNGGWGNGGFRNGGFYNGGFRNGGFNNW